MSQREKTIKALDHAGNLIGRLGAAGGLRGLPLVGVSALLKTAAQVMRDRDEDIDDLLLRLRAPRDLKMPWSAREEQTTPERPSAKREPR